MSTDLVRVTKFIQFCALDPGKHAFKTKNGFKSKRPVR